MLVTVSIVSVEICSTSIAGSQPIFLECYYFGEVTVLWSRARGHNTFSENRMRNIVKNDQYCERCDIIEACDKHVQYVKYVFW